YIGRSVDWKMMPLLKILEDIYTEDVHIEFHLIVSSCQEMLTYIPISKYKNRIDFHIVENLSYVELDMYLQKTNIDLGFAMGTSVLDFAKNGIPSIVVDYSRKNFPE